MIDVQKLVAPEYYLESLPLTDFGLGVIPLIVFLLGVLSPFWMKPMGSNKAYKKVSFWAPVTFGCVGVLLLIMREGGVPYLSMRLWLYLCTMGTLVGIISTHANLKFYQQKYKKK